jgi:hypothetical protein
VKSEEWNMMRWLSRIASERTVGEHRYLVFGVDGLAFALLKIMFP